MFVTTRSKKLCRELPRSTNERPRLRVPKILRMGKLPPPEDGYQAEEEELPTSKDGLENIGRIRRIRHNPMLSPLRRSDRSEGPTA
jgi:hypothetical protein